MQTVVSVFGVKPFRIGGTETFARELSRQLGEHHWKSVLCFLEEPTPEVREFLSLPNVSIEVLADATHFSLAAASNLGRIIRRHSPQVLHLHFTGFLGPYVWVARMLGVRQIFFTDHSSRPAAHSLRRASVLKRAMARAVNQPLTKVICVSDYGLRCLTTLGLLPTDRHTLIYNAVDLSRVSNDARRALEFRERYGIPKDRVVILQVSWMIPEKGIRALLEAARILVEQNANAHFVLVGEGAQRQQFMDDAAKLGISERVTWTGLVEDPFGAGVYDAADIICQLSQWEELFGWMIAEGMAYGKPIVATRVGGIPELVNDGESGFLVKRDDTEAAAEKLLQLIKDPDLRHKMGAAGRRVVAEKFDLKTNVAELVAQYGI
ncbi:MAG TPA: glycosyltransferase family 4 protein [Pyrinomonadaceae bacterium]|nr:glycosyltransferase family 4 protein [Pyrinomonadaceae bacterium]